MDLKVRKHIYFYGRVQGVGFRYYAVQKAGQLGLAGWVRNRYDGSVEMEVEGAETDIDQMILFLPVSYTHLLLITAFSITKSCGCIQYFHKNKQIISKTY